MARRTRSPSSVGLDRRSRRRRGASTDATAPTGGLVVEQQHLLEADVADLAGLAEDGARGGQRHLAVGGAGQRRHVVHLVVAQPRLAPVPTSACQTWRSGSSGSRTCAPSSGCTATVWRAVRLAILAVAVEQQLAVGPGRQRRVDQPPVGVQHREVHCGARAVQIGHEAAQPVRQLLLAAHARPAPRPACRGCWRSARRRGSAAGAATARRTPGSRLPARPAPPRRTAPCGAGCPPSSRRRKSARSRGSYSVAE